MTTCFVVRVVGLCSYIVTSRVTDFHARRAQVHGGTSRHHQAHHRTRNVCHLRFGGQQGNKKATSSKGIARRRRPRVRSPAPRMPDRRSPDGTRSTSTVRGAQITPAPSPTSDWGTRWCNDISVAICLAHPNQSMVHTRAMDWEHFTVGSARRTWARSPFQRLSSSIRGPRWAADHVVDARFASTFQLSRTCPHLCKCDSAESAPKPPVRHRRRLATVA
jgi:hypothetical protein